MYDWEFNHDMHNLLEKVTAGINDPYLANLAKWQFYARVLEQVKHTEMELRKGLFDGAFPTPKEGTNKYTLPDGRIIKGTLKMNRKVDQAAAISAGRKLREEIGAKVDDLFPVELKFSKRIYDTLTDEQQKTASEAIIITPGSPALEIV